ncbi:barstar family protein [Streptomyces angustmyceticus]|uniref:barstar family protein n=1 Tax=Streptomyces angustmyceticus TaxID=285578 RepID=UPI0037F26A81
MRVADQAAWDRDFPVRHLLVREDEDGETEYWGRCAGVEGLFLDKVPPPREVLTLHGCTPTGALRDALSPAGERTGLLGDVCVEVWDEQQPLQWWTLIDTVVLACRPNRGDPALVGPGGYFGREWNAFKDCLGGGFGVAPPFPVIWHDAEVARRALAGTLSDPDGKLSCFEDIVRPLERCGVTAVLQ